MQKWSERDRLNLADWTKRLRSSGISTKEGPFTFVVGDLWLKYNLHYNTGLNVDPNNGVPQNNDNGDNSKGIVF